MRLNICRVGGKVWDLTRPLEGDCSLEYCSFEDPAGREVTSPYPKARH